MKMFDIVFDIGKCVGYNDFEIQRTPFLKNMF